MFALEVTDTFGGEANYSWVRRGTSNARTRRGIVRAIKRITGWPRVKVDIGGENADFYSFLPSNNSGICQIAFATWQEND